MTSTVETAEVHVPIANRRADWLLHVIMSVDTQSTGVEYFELLARIREEGAALGGMERWDRVLRWIDKQLNEHQPIAVILLGALHKFTEVLQFPRP